MRHLTLRLCVMMLCLRGALNLVAQTTSPTYLGAIGNPNFSVNVPVPDGYINLANGNLHLEFPLAAHKQRGALALNEKLVYDSRIWEIIQYHHYYWWPLNVANSMAGWRFVKGNETGTVSYSEVYSTNNPSPECPDEGSAGDAYLSITWEDPSGTQHSFDGYVDQHSDSCGPSSQQIIGGYALDASGYSVKDDGSGNPLIFDHAGTQVYPNVVDRYGNYWSTDSDGNLIDDLDRTPVITTQNGNTIYYDVLAPNGPISNNGTRVRYTVTLEQLALSTAFNQSGVVEYQDNGNPPGSNHPSVTAIQSIQLPDGSAYQFNYDTYGEIKSVTLPTGGTVQYGWSNYQDSYQNENRWLTSSTIDNNATTYTPSVITQCSSGGTGCQEQVNVHRPSGDEQVYTLTLNNGAWNTATTIYSGAASGGQALVSDSSIYNFSRSCINQYCNGAAYITKSLETTSLLDAGSETQIQTDYANPAHDQLTSWAQWDYFASGSSPSSTPTRQISYGYTGYDLTSETHYDQKGNPVAATAYNYTTSATTTSGIVGHGSNNAGGPYLTSIIKTTSFSQPASVTESFTYDDTGSLQTATDFDNNQTTFKYDPTDTFITETDRPDTATAGTIYHHVTKASYDQNTGALLTTDDENSVANSQAYTVHYAYEPVAGRLQSINYPDGGSTTYSYPSSNEVDKAVVQNATTSVTVASLVDSYGRPYQTASGGITSEQSYDTNGRPFGVAAPHLVTQPSPTDGTTYTYYDTLDRPIGVKYPDGNSTSTTYTGNVATAQDELGNKIQRTFNAFGELTQVMEPDPSTGALALETDYQIDGLGNVTCMEQHGKVVGTGCSASPSSDASSPWRVRRFSYDAVAHLRAAEIPEHSSSTNSPAQNCGTPDGGSTWTDCYYYDPNGNQTSTKDNRGVVTTVNYDALNRMTTRSTSGFSHSYAYDQNTNGVGHLASQSNTVNAGSSYTYDVMGRITAEVSCHEGTCPGACFWTSVQYDKAGNIAQITYPDGRVMQNNFDTLNRLSSVVYQQWGSQHVGTTYWSAISYAPPGQLTGAQLGAVQLQAGYNDRQSITSLSYQNGSGTIFGKTYQWDLNASNLIAETNQQNSQVRQFSYDKLNRLASAIDLLPNGGGLAPGGLNQSYSIDNWGNLGSMGTSGFTQPINNQNQVGTFEYDATGRLVNDGVKRYTYDDSNMLASSSDGATYTYDGAAQRVATSAGTTKEYYYLSGVLIATRNSATGIWTDMIYAGRQRVAQVPGNQTSTPDYSIADHVGSEVATVDASGNTISSLDYSPWGQVIAGNIGGGYFYTGLERDSSGLDHAVARQYSLVTARWTVPDPYDGSYNPNDPQTLNRYAYVRNMPLSLVDPSGMSSTQPVPCGDQFCMSTSTSECDIICAIFDVVNGISLFFNGGSPPFHGNVNAQHHPARSQQSATQQCLNQYNKSPVGKTIKFFSVYNLVTDFKNAWLDWTLLPAAKMAALTGLKATSQAVGGTEILSTTGGATTIITSPTAGLIEAGEGLGATLAGPGILDATAIDMTVLANCDADGRQASGQWYLAPGQGYVSF